MSEINKESHPETSTATADHIELRYRTTDPTRPDVAELQGKFREALDGIALDDETHFDDKLFALEATQRGIYREYRANPVVQSLNAAKKQFVMMNASSMLIVGLLAPENPWTFLDISREDTATTIDLGVRFKDAYEVSDTQRWLHESYGQASWRSGPSPSVRRIGNEQIPVGLPLEPVGSENLYGKVEAFAKSIKIGEFDIHHKIVGMQRELGDVPQAALHSAVSIAISRMSQE